MNDPSSQCAVRLHHIINLLEHKLLKNDSALARCRYRSVLSFVKLAALQEGSACPRYHVITTPFCTRTLSFFLCPVCTVRMHCANAILRFSINDAVILKKCMFKKVDDMNRTAHWELG